MIFPNLNSGPDQKYYSEKLEDPAIRSKTEGGYEFSRPRFTRAPRKTYSLGYTNISNSDKLLLDQFWKDVKGGSEAFTWQNPVTGQSILVRFTKEIEFKYDGVGGIHRWNTSFELREV